MNDREQKKVRRDVVNAAAYSKGQVSRTITICYDKKIERYADEDGVEMMVEKPIGMRRVINVAPECTLSSAEIAYNYYGVVLDEIPRPVHKRNKK